MTQATTLAAESGARPMARPKRLRWRHLWLVPGLAIAIFANQLGNANGLGILAMIAFGIAPDVPRLFGARGRPVHDVLHHPAPPIAAVAVAATGVAAAPGVVGAVWLVAALVWLSHVVIGRGIGDVPRNANEGSGA